MTRYSPTEEPRVKQKGCKTDLSDMEQLVLDKHNEYRARHQDTPPLCYAEITGDDVEFMAQEWADHVGETGKFKHTPNPKVYGENMAWSSFRGEDPDENESGSLESLVVGVFCHCSGRTYSE